MNTIIIIFVTGASTLKEISDQNKRMKGLLAFVGIILVALNTRAGITSLSPIYNQIAESFPISAIAQGIIGMLPPVIFALVGWVTPRLISRRGLEKTAIIAMLWIFGGIVARSFSNDIWMFGSLFVVCLAGMGMSNVLLPPVIKQYFPDSIGLMTSIYSSLIPLSVALTSAIAVPATQVWGWRFSTAIWAVIAILAMIPWLRLMKTSQPIAQTHVQSHIRAWRWPTTYALSIIFGLGIFNFYVVLAWLPKILMSFAGVNQATAGIMLSTYAAFGVIPALLVPIGLARVKHPFWIVAFLTIGMMIGLLGFIYYPAWVWAWIFLMSLGQSLIPTGLTLVNLRCRTTGGSTALSGFVQGVGYIMGAAGPLIFGALFNMTGEWEAALWFMIAVGLVATVAAIFSVRKKYIEDFENSII
jgi:CP family cyanate transporter-like MFS transporter